MLHMYYVGIYEQGTARLSRNPYPCPCACHSPTFFRQRCRDFHSKLSRLARATTPTSKPEPFSPTCASQPSLYPIRQSTFTQGTLAVCFKLVEIGAPWASLWWEGIVAT